MFSLDAAVYSRADWLTYCTVLVTTYSLSKRGGVRVLGKLHTPTPKS